MALRGGSGIQVFRIAMLVVLLLICGLTVAQFVMSNESVATESATPSNVTVATVNGNGPGQLVAHYPNGSVLYRNRSHLLYHDVDPVPQTRRTVMYVASDHLDESHCEGSTGCIRNIVERVNLTTGNVTRLYSRVSPRIGSSQVHDVDRVNDSVLLVGDIGPPDRVYMVNTTTERIIWEWRVSQAYAPSSGGAYPEDWTHLNDVAYLADGRVLVNLRNQDQVIFLRPGRGLRDDWTLGCDDCHQILYEQHNPDYIPATNGGPALLIADSENNRIVEHQRRDGSWNRTWVWSDDRLQWPRDADRLPNGHTLIVDSYGKRIFEVNQTGDIVWQISVPDGVYDVERLGTGDESTDGPSMWKVSSSSYVGKTNPVTALVPNLVLHGALSILPGWVSPTAGAALLLGGVTVLLWGTVESVVWIIKNRAGDV